MMKRVRDSIAELKAKVETSMDSPYRMGLLEAYAFCLSQIDAELAHERALENIPEFYEGRDATAKEMR